MNRCCSNASSALNVDELHQEISVRSLILIIPLIILWTHTHTDKLLGVFSTKSIEEVQENKMLLEKLQVKMNEAEAKANKLKVSFENLLEKETRGLIFEKT